MKQDIEFNMGGTRIKIPDLDESQIFTKDTETSQIVNQESEEEDLKENVQDISDFDEKWRLNDNDSDEIRETKLAYRNAFMITKNLQNQPDYVISHNKQMSNIQGYMDENVNRQLREGLGYPSDKIITDELLNMCYPSSQTFNVKNEMDEPYNYIYKNVHDESKTHFEKAKNKAEELIETYDTQKVQDPTNKNVVQDSEEIRHSNLINELYSANKNVGGFIKSTHDYVASKSDIRQKFEQELDDMVQKTLATHISDKKNRTIQEKPMNLNDVTLKLFAKTIRESKEEGKSDIFENNYVNNYNDDEMEYSESKTLGSRIESNIVTRRPESEYKTVVPADSYRTLTYNVISNEKNPNTAQRVVITNSDRLRPTETDVIENVIPHISNEYVIPHNSNDYIIHHSSNESKEYQVNNIYSSSGNIENAYSSSKIGGKSDSADFNNNPLLVMNEKLFHSRTNNSTGNIRQVGGSMDNLLNSNEKRLTDPPVYKITKDSDDYTLQKNYPPTYTAPKNDTDFTNINKNNEIGQIQNNSISISKDSMNFVDNIYKPGSQTSIEYRKPILIKTISSNAVTTSPNDSNTLSRTYDSGTVVSPKKVISSNQFPSAYEPKMVQSQYPSTYNQNSVSNQFPSHYEQKVVSNQFPYEQKAVFTKHLGSITELVGDENKSSIDDSSVKSTRKQSSVDKYNSINNEKYWTQFSDKYFINQMDPDMRYISN